LSAVGRAVRIPLTFAAYTLNRDQAARRGAMAGTGPSILVVADDRRERELIVATLGEAGFAAISATRASARKLWRGRVAAAVVALAEADALAAVIELRLLQPGLPTVVVVEPTESRPLEEDCATVVKRPLDPRQLLGCVVELVLRTDELAAPAPRHSTAAELGIAAARLACLYNRHSVAAAAGAARLAQDLKRQIGELRSTCLGLSTSGGLAVEGCVG
jgi:DNA-binding response OmpR family regulator